MSNYVPRSSTLKYDDVVGVILSEETCRKSIGGSTSGSALNAQRVGRWLREEIILEIMKNQEKSEMGRALNLEDQEIVSTMVK